jgi:uncharacterized protein YdeI (YjbR/CyaY-like superfamily)
MSHSPSLQDTPTAYRVSCRPTGNVECMEITETVEPANRGEWRAWLERHHTSKTEIWLVSPRKNKPFTYLESVLEALCFGWIDGIGKVLDTERSAQRFTPRRPRGNWTELNKERVRQLIADGLMTPAGLAVAPDLTIIDLVIAPDVEAALQAQDRAWENFVAFPELYKRIRIGYVEEMRKQPAEFDKRLANLAKQSALNKMFGGAEATAT